MSEKKLITEEIRKKLNAPFPPEAISQHPTKKFLSTLKAIYVVERLNDVFGLGRWTLKHEIAKETEGYVLAKGKIVLFDFRADMPWQYGGHNTTGTNTELADGYKSAITDCLSKCASYLEIGIDVFKGKTTHNSIRKNPVIKNVATKTEVDHVANLKAELVKRGAKTEQEAVELFNNLTGENIKSLKIAQATAQKYLFTLMNSPMGKK